MNVEEFRIRLKPPEDSTSKAFYDELSLHHAAEAVRAARSELQYDSVECSRIYSEPMHAEEILFYESPLGHFRIGFELSGQNDDELSVSMSFEYCNPRSVYIPFLEVVELIMRQFGLECHCDENYPADMKDAPRVIAVPQWLLVLLAPIMNYNKDLWHSEAETIE